MATLAPSRTKALHGGTINATGAPVTSGDLRLQSCDEFQKMAVIDSAAGANDLSEPASSMIRSEKGSMHPAACLPRR